jgi:hypothetical protein
MFSALVEQATRGPFFFGVLAVSLFVIAASAAYRKHSSRGVVILFLTCWCALFLLYVSALGVGFTWGPTSYVQKAFAIFLALGIPLFLPTACLIFGRKVATRDWADFVLALSAGIVGVFIFPGAGLVLVCLLSGDCL